MTPLKKSLRSFSFAWKGILAAFKSELNMKIHFFIAVFVVFFGLFLKISVTEWLIVLICFAIVFSAEMINTSIETLVDKVSPEQNPLAGKAKDVAAGAVLIVAIFVAIVGLIIFVPKIICLFN